MLLRFGRENKFSFCSTIATFAEQNIIDKLEESESLRWQAERAMSTSNLRILGRIPGSGFPMS